MDILISYLIFNILMNVIRTMEFISFHLFFSYRNRLLKHLTKILQKNCNDLNISV